MKQYLKSVLQLIGTVCRAVFIVPFIVIGIVGVVLVKLGEFGEFLTDWTTDVSLAMTVCLRPKFWRTLKDLQRENVNLKKQLEMQRLE